jgi:AAA family ATP:ADP antiporter
MIGTVPQLPHPFIAQVLFTVVSRTEKYSAKLVIDMVVQRLGDSIAAAAFQLLDVQLQLGVGGVAIAGCATCGAWLVAAVRLGRVHVRLAQERQRHEDGRRQKQDV